MRLWPRVTCSESQARGRHDERLFQLRASGARGTRLHRGCAGTRHAVPLHRDTHRHARLGVAWLGSAQPGEAGGGGAEAGPRDGTGRKGRGMKGRASP